ncbi:hypothetical protein COV24_04600 [candidate division WWE3 bacterium CG10_big_fil_rev_8_21_14_0_10_32_10]|uniref:DUF1189 domain-containing protein n=1 Tax=candidate division WWE3 bacterium CG10_big_fil_rev_8_21_14_0_10_32_10 TaxID=1975090 RepID=A0A2H0R974_UNCKA|nr:MAG: hypothetical protein COV24_04600 [candidate division WWE3 bacterium CG10_big_fil_rev_8_21_14_0_10_32_10]
MTLDNNKSASYKVYSLKDIKEDLIINRALYEEILIKITPYLAYMDVITYLLLGMFLLVFPFVFAFFSLIGKMLYLLFWTLFAVLISKIAKANLNYKKLYKMGLHALTLPILITFTLNLLNMSFPFLYTLIYIAFITYIISQYKNNKLKTYATKK